MADTCYNFNDARKIYKNLDGVFVFVEQLIQLIKEFPDLLNPAHDLLISLKEAQDFMEYQNVEKIEYRNPEHDHVFPMETIEINMHRESNENVEKVLVHTGSYANEIARSFNALAVTLAADIYFRNGTYNPTSEEGRGLLAHEVTHVAQHEEKRTKQEDIEKLEAEAVLAEKIIEKKESDYIVFEYDGQICRFPRKYLHQMVKDVSNDTIDWVQKQKDVLSKEEYLKLLVKFKKWIEKV